MGINLRLIRLVKLYSYLKYYKYMELTLAEVKPIIKYIINNNKELQEKGQLPIAVNICGEAGIGKLV